MERVSSWSMRIAVLGLLLLALSLAAQAGAAPARLDPATPLAPPSSDSPPAANLQQPGHQPEVDPQILEEMAASTAEATGFFVLFGAKADLSPSYQAQSWQQQGRLVYSALKATAEQSQARVRQWLDAKGIPYRSFLIDNSIFVTADKRVLQDLAAFSEVAGFRANRIHPLEPIISEEPLAFPTGVVWNIAQVGADQVWQDFGIKGQGVVVANIDTGVEYTHDALHANYKCGDGPHADCWYDPSAVCPDPNVPCDNAGHGTHTMGTMAGDDDPALAYNVGMAPDAQWIACKGCEDMWCSDFALTACADWILAPNGNPDNRPNVVNNSWGGGGCDEWYRDKVVAWRAAGIFPAFSAGNAGSDCSTLGSPGDYPESFATGATDVSDEVAWFSSRGPSCYDEIKPEVSAPGVDVCSSVPGNGWDCSYSGTSMSSPHTAGLVALLWSAAPSLIGDIDQTEDLITSTATCLSDLSCGGEECHNNVYGWGRIDAYQAASRVAWMGYLNGYVRDTGALPLSGATIRAERTAGGLFRAETGPTGYYTTSLPAGTYTVTAALYGYYPETVTAIEIITDEVTTHDFALAPAPTYVVSGRVSDDDAGWPLYAHVAVEGDPIDPPPPIGDVWTDPLSGEYSVTLAAGITYTFRVEAWLPGYLPAVRSVGPLTADETQDFALEADAEACTAPGHLPDLAYYEDFEVDDGEFKATGETSWGWGVPSGGPGRAHSGTKVWATNPRGNYSDAEDGYAVSPAIDLSAYAGHSLHLSWWQWLQTEGCCDFASVEVSDDGGATWQRVYGEVGGNVDLAWTRHWLLLGPSYAVDDFRLRFRLYTDWSVTYPGFYVDDIGILPISPPVVYSQDFDGSDGGFATGGTTSFDWGPPTSGPGAAHSGTNVWATNLAGNYGHGEDGYVESPDLNLSAYAGQTLFVSWWQWLKTESLFDYASVEVSADGGVDWEMVYGEVSGNVDLAWQQRGVALDPAYAVENFRIRFRLRSDGSIAYPGFYVDDLSIAASPSISVDCLASPGGLVLGNVYDANTLEPLVGATVADDSGHVATTMPTEDPEIDEGFYVLFSPPGEHPFSASMEGGYATEVAVVDVEEGEAVRQDFWLAAGWLAYTPELVSATLDMGLTTTVRITLTNQGERAVDFALQEQDRGFEPLRRTIIEGQASFSAAAPVGPLSVRSAKDGASPQAGTRVAPLGWLEGSPVPGGVVRYAHAQCLGDDNSFYVISGVDADYMLTDRTWRYDADTDTWNELAPFPAAQEGPTGVCYEGRIYVMGGGGTNQFYIYDIALDSWSAGPALPRNVWGAAAAAWDGRIYLAGGDADFWFGDTSGEVTIYDVAANAWVGNGAPLPVAAHLPGFVQAGPTLYLVGGWGDSSPVSNLDATQRYDLSDDSWEVGPVFASARADLALALTNHYLYALGGDADGGGPFDPTATVERLDWTAWPGDAWQDVGDPLPASYTSNNAGFCTNSLAGGEVWSVGGFDGGSIVGDLWARPSEACFAADVPWLFEEPVSGTIATSDQVPISVTLDASVPQVDQPGTYLATLRVANDAPYGTPRIPVRMAVLPPATWGKLTGIVYSLGYCDVNTTTLEGAQVLLEADGGQTVTLQTDADGRYLRWLEEGDYNLTVSASDHLPQTFVVTVTPGETFVQEVSLRADQPCLQAAPTAFEVWIVPGTQKTRSITLRNDGARDLAFEFLEMASSLPISPAGEILDLQTRAGGEVATNLGASRSAAPTTYHYQGGGPPPGTVLLCSDSCYAYPPSTCGEVALQNLGVSYDLYYQDWLGCEAAIGSGAYDLVVIDNTCFFPSGSLFDALDSFLVAGGRAVINTFDMDAYATHPLWATAGVAYASDVVASAPPPVHRWQASHPVVANWPSDPLQFDDLYDDDGDRFDSLPTAQALAGYTPLPETGQGALALRRDNRAIVSGFCLENLAWRDDDEDGTMDCAEVWQDAVSWLLFPPSDVPWLSAQPVSGLVPADDSRKIKLTFTAAPTMPHGVYLATLLLLSDDALGGAVYVSVELHVTGKPHCDFESSSPDDLGQTTVFTNTSVGEEPLSFAWDLGDGTPAVTTSDLSHTYDQMGRYTVVLTATNAYGSESCSDIVSIEGLPVAGFWSNSPVLLGDVLVLTNTTLANPPVTTWVWNLGDGGHSSDANPTHTYAREGTYEVTLVAVNARGAGTHQGVVEVILPGVIPIERYLPVLFHNFLP